MNSMRHVLLAIQYGKRELKVALSYDMNECPQFVNDDETSEQSLQWMHEQLPLYCQTGPVLRIETSIFATVVASIASKTIDLSGPESTGVKYTKTTHV